MIKALKDEDDYVRGSAAYAIGKIGDGRAVEPLIEALEDEYSDVREQAAEALGEIDWQPKDDVERAYYLIAIEQWDKLVKLGEPAVEPLTGALKDEDWHVCERVTGALGKIKEAISKETNQELAALVEGQATFKTTPKEQELKKVKNVLDPWRSTNTRIVYFTNKRINIVEMDKGLLKDIKDKTNRQGMLTLSVIVLAIGIGLIRLGGLAGSLVISTIGGVLIGLAILLDLRSMRVSSPSSGKEWTYTIDYSDIKKVLLKRKAFVPLVLRPTGPYASLVLEIKDRRNANFVFQRAEFDDVSSLLTRLLPDRVEIK